MRVKLPYGCGFQTLDIDDGADVEVLSSNAGKAFQESDGNRDEDRIVREAMASPTGSPRLAELARGARNAVIICSDHTRPVPSRKIIPHMLEEIRNGNPNIQVTLLVATGTHRAPSRAELEQKFGAEIVQSETIEIHDCKNLRSMRNIGRLPSGAGLVINGVAAGTDLLVAEGFIEPHFFAGFSGGRKSVLPGICAYETVLGNHCAAFIADPAARTGVLAGNPIHRDMLAAQRLARLAYIVNVIIDNDKRVVKAFAGDAEKAHARGCDALAALCRVKPGRKADIVITTNGGAPLDLNIYQAVKCMTAAEAAAAPGAVIVALSECWDGAGGSSFYSMMSECESPETLLDAIKRVPMDKTSEDQWQAQILARILIAHPVILVCAPGARAIAEKMKLLTAGGVDEALDYARNLLRDKSAATTRRRADVPGIAPNIGEPDAAPHAGEPSITVIPDGVSVIVDSLPAPDMGCGRSGDASPVLSI